MTRCLYHISLIVWALKQGPPSPLLRSNTFQRAPSTFNGSFPMLRGIEQDISTPAPKGAHGRAPFNGRRHASCARPASIGPDQAGGRRSRHRRRPPRPMRRGPVAGGLLRGVGGWECAPWPWSLTKLLGKLRGFPPNPQKVNLFAEGQQQPSLRFPHEAIPNEASYRC